MWPLKELILHYTKNLNFMKIKLFIASLFFLANNVFAQTDQTICIIKDTEIQFPVKDNEIFYQKIISDSTMSSSEIYTNVKIFITENYKSANDVIQMDDKNAGIIIVKGLFDLSELGAKVLIYHTAKFFIKDGKLKIEFSNFHSNLSPMVGYTGPITDCNLKDLHLYTVQGLSKGWRKSFIIDIYNKTKTITNSLLVSSENILKTKVSNDW